MHKKTTGIVRPMVDDLAGTAAVQAVSASGGDERSGSARGRSSWWWSRAVNARVRVLRPLTVQARCARPAVEVRVLDEPAGVDVEIVREHASTVKR